MEEVETPQMWSKRMNSYSTDDFVRRHARQLALRVDGSAVAFVVAVFGPGNDSRHARPVDAALLDELAVDPGRWRGALFEPISGGDCAGAAGRFLLAVGDETVSSSPLEVGGQTAYLVHVNDRRNDGGRESGQ